MPRHPARAAQGGRPGHRESRTGARPGARRGMTVALEIAAMKPELPAYTIPAETVIGHVHLKVADLERALDFYCGVLGFQLTSRYGPQAAFVSAGGYHHHIGLNT